MKRNFLHALLFSAAVVGLASCGDDDDNTPSNYFTVDSTTKGVVTSYGFATGDSEDADGKTYYMYDLLFADISATATSGKGSYFELYLNSSTEALADGTYTVVDAQTAGKANQITDTEDAISLDFTVTSNGTDGGTDYDIVSGSAVVKKSGDTYTIDFTGKAVKSGDSAANAKDVKLHFSGKLSTL